MERWQSLVECAALEMQFTLTCNGGSNPSLSATYALRTLILKSHLLQLAFAISLAIAQTYSE